MKRYLQQVGSEKWLSESGTLTSSFFNAQELQSVEEAIDLCSAHNLSDMEIILWFGPYEEVRIPVEDSNLSPTSPRPRGPYLNSPQY